MKSLTFTLEKASKNNFMDIKRISLNSKYVFWVQDSEEVLSQEINNRKQFYKHLVKYLKMP